MIPDNTSSSAMTTTIAKYPATWYPRSPEIAGDCYYNHSGGDGDNNNDDDDHFCQEESERMVREVVETYRSLTSSSEEGGSRLSDRSTTSTVDDGPEEITTTTKMTTIIGLPPHRDGVVLNRTDTPDTVLCSESAMQRNNGVRDSLESLEEEVPNQQQQQQHVHVQWWNMSHVHNDYNDDDDDDDDDTPPILLPPPPPRRPPPLPPKAQEEHLTFQSISAIIENALAPTMLEVVLELFDEAWYGIPSSLALIGNLADPADDVIPALSPRMSEPIPTTVRSALPLRAAALESRTTLRRTKTAFTTSCNSRSGAFLSPRRSNPIEVEAMFAFTSGLAAGTPPSTPSSSDIASTTS